MPAVERRWPWLFLVTALIPGHLFDWATEWAFASSTTILGVWYFQRTARRYPLGARIGIVTLFAVTCVSWVGYIFTLALATFPTGIRDVVELLKPTMVFFSGALTLAFGPPRLENLRRACFWVLAYGVICGLILMFDVPMLSSLVDTLYGSTKTGFSEFHVRLSIPFENPNFLGLLAVLSLAISLSFASRPDLKLAAVSLCAAGLSGSRTAWLTSVLVLTVFLVTVVVTVITDRRNLSVPTLALAVGLPLAAIYFLPVVAESFQRLESFIELITSFDLGADHSYSERLALRENATILILERPVVGWGAIKYTNLDIVDSQYFSLLLRFGVLGSLILLVAAAAGVFANLRPLAGTRDLKSGVLMWLVLAAWLWNGTFIENIRLAILITIIFASASRAHAEPAH